MARFLGLHTAPDDVATERAESRPMLPYGLELAFDAMGIDAGLNPVPASADQTDARQDGTTRQKAVCQRQINSGGPGTEA
jgi:hypothetical protein